MDTQITVKIEGNRLIISLPMKATPTPSATGKTLVVATTAGNIPTTATVNGQAVIVGCNAYIRR